MQLPTIHIENEHGLKWDTPALSAREILEQARELLTPATLPTGRQAMRWKSGTWFDTKTYHHPQHGEMMVQQACSVGAMLLAKKLFGFQGSEDWGSLFKSDPAFAQAMGCLVEAIKEQHTAWHQTYWGESVWDFQTYSDGRRALDHERLRGWIQQPAAAVNVITGFNDAQNQTRTGWETIDQLFEIAIKKAVEL